MKKENKLMWWIGLPMFVGFIVILVLTCPVVSYGCPSYMYSNTALTTVFEIMAGVGALLCVIAFVSEWWELRHIKVD